MKKKLIGFVFAILSLIFILLDKSIVGMSGEGQRCLALFIMFFFLYSFEVMDAALISLSIIPLLVIFRVVDVGSALTGFSSSSTYLIVGAFIISAAMLKSRLGNRITYCILKLVGTKATNISLGIMLVSIIMSFLIPSSTARTAMLLPICLSIIEKYQGNKAEKTKFGANLMMTLCCTNSAASAGILTATITNPMAVQYIEKATGVSVSYKDWMMWGGPPALICMVIAWIIIQIIFRPEKKEMENGSSYVREELARMGRVSVDEIKVIIVLAAAMLLWFLGDLFNIDSCTVCLAAACLLCIPVIGVIKWEDCKKDISINVMFVVSGGISLGAAMYQTGTAKWLAETIFKAFSLDQLSVGIIILLIIVILQFMHAFFAGTATMANVFFPVVVGIASVANISVMALILISGFIIGGYPIIMFYSTTPNILCYETGHLAAGDFLKFGTILSIFVCIVYGLCIVYYWPLVGML